jgi:hypothetical protein
VAAQLVAVKETRDPEDACELEDFDALPMG